MISGSEAALQTAENEGGRGAPSLLAGFSFRPATRGLRQLLRAHHRKLASFVTIQALEDV